MRLLALNIMPLCMHEILRKSTAALYCDFKTRSLPFKENTRTQGRIAEGLMVVESLFETKFVLIPQYVLLFAETEVCISLCHHSQR